MLFLLTIFFLVFTNLIQKLSAGPLTVEVHFTGVTPLHVATRKGYNAIVADLLRAGADPEILDLLGQKAIEYANPKTRAIFDFELHPNTNDNDSVKEET